MSRMYTVLAMTCLLALAGPLAAQPANDLCTGAFPVGPGSHPYNNTGAGFNPFSVKISCWLDPGLPANHDVWFEYTTTSTGTVNISATAGYGWIIGLYNQSTCAAGVLASDELACATSGGAGVISYPITLGQTFLLRVAGYPGGPLPMFGPGTLIINELPVLTNDDCNTATPLTLPTVADYFVTGATESLGFACDRNEDVWFVFQAPATGELVVSTELNFGLHTIYAAPGGPSVCPTDLDQLGGCGPQVLSTTLVTLGSTYFIRIGPEVQGNSLVGKVIAFVRPPLSNDDCTSPMPLALGATTPVSSADATSHGVGLACMPNGLDTWFEVTPGSSGVMTSSFSTVIPPVGGHDPVRQAIYHYSAPMPGMCPTDLDQLVCGEMADATVTVTAGETYLIRISHWANSFHFTGDLTVMLGTANASDDCSSPTLVPTLPATLAIDTTNATSDASIAGCTPMNEDVWFSVSPAADGVLVASTSGAIEASMAVYFLPGGAGCPSSLDVLSCAQSGLGGTTISGTSVQAGQVYLVRISDEAGGAVTGTLDLVLDPPLTNDHCTAATSVTVPGVTTVSNGGATVDTTGLACSQGPDVWYQFTAPNTATLNLTFSASVSHAVYHDVSGGTGLCPLNSDQMLCAPVGVTATFDVLAGESYYIRLGKSGYFSVDMTIDFACDPVAGLTCSYDCDLNETQIDWVFGPHLDYDVISDLDGALATGLPAGSLLSTTLSNGLHTITVIGTCANLGIASSTCQVFVGDPVTAGTDLILALEGLSTGGDLGATDSATALAAALTSNGQTVSVLVLTDFHTWPCMGTFVTAAERLWVMTGTFPANYVLNPAQADFLASTSAAGTPVYLEGSDHWSFAAASTLDARDGVGPASVSGDDSLTSLAGVDAGVTDGDFSGYTSVGYNQDNIVGTDSTDQLDLATADAGVSSGAIWRRDGLVNDYVVGVLAIHDTDGGRVLSSSFEFGGFAGDQVGLAADYMVALSGPASALFRRGDANGDGTINIADAVYELGHLFPGAGTPNVLACLDAADANSDGMINIADAIALLGSLFGVTTVPLPQPYPDCGVGLLIGCDSYPNCP